MNSSIVGIRIEVLVYFALNIEDIPLDILLTPLIKNTKIYIRLAALLKANVTPSDANR